MSDAHPITTHEIHVFLRVTANELEPKGATAVSRFYPYDTYPIFFTGFDTIDALEKAEDFRKQTIINHEAAYVARAKANAERKAKKVDA